jgi:hypothetical protein
MGMTLALVGFILALADGLALVHCLWPGDDQINWLFRLSLAVGLGFGASSLPLFCWLMVFGAFSPGYFVADLLFTVALVAFALARNRRQPLKPPVERMRLGRVSAIGICFVAILASALFTFIAASVRNPNGGYDGWEIWDMRARFLYRGGPDWQNGHSQLLAYSHPDYPLLVSLSIARGWFYSHSETPVIPAAVAGLFTFATVGLLVASISKLTTLSQGLLSGILLAGTPLFALEGASQYADVPLSCFYLTCLVLLVLAMTRPCAGLWTLLGLAAGCCTWTKNEGWLFLICLIAAGATFQASRSGIKACGRSAMFFAAGLMPYLIALVSYKHILAPANDLVSAQGADTLHRLTDLSRHVLVLRSFAIWLWHFGQWEPLDTIVIAPPLLLLFYAIVAGVDFKPIANIRFALVTILSVPALVAAGYYLVYILTPHPLQWHIETSLSRLLLQLWPAFLFVYFLAVRPVESFRGEAALAATASTP